MRLVVEPGRIRLYENSSHPQRMRRFEVHHKVFKHSSAFGINGVGAQERFIRLAFWLWRIARRLDVEYLVEMVADAQRIGDVLGVFYLSVGEDEFASRQGTKRRVQRRIFYHVRKINIVDEFQKLIGTDVMLGHQPVHGRAISDVIIFLHAPRIVRRHGETVLNVSGHQCIDLREESAVGRVKRIVEVKDPRIHMRKIRGHAGAAVANGIGQSPLNLLLPG